MSAKILIVEDNTDTRNFLAHLLELKGYTVYSAADGSEGIQQAKLDCPDLIISDISMPNLDGIEMLKVLRKTPECSKIPILVMSAYGSGRLSDAVTVGADQVLPKPLDCELLFKAIHKLLN